MQVMINGLVKILIFDKMAASQKQFVFREILTLQSCCKTLNYYQKSYYFDNYLTKKKISKKKNSKSSKTRLKY